MLSLNNWFEEPRREAYKGIRYLILVMAGGRQEEKALLGIAGVYFVAGELSKRGYIALVTSRNTKSYDILAFNPKTKRSIPIQVKTTKQQRKKDITLDGYILFITDSERLESKLKEIDAPFIFVYFPKDEKDKTRYFITPPSGLREAVRKAWNDYIEKPNHRKPVEEIKRTRMPQGPLIKHLLPYENRWELLEKE